MRWSVHLLFRNTRSRWKQQGSAEMNEFTLMHWSSAIPISCLTLVWSVFVLYEWSLYCLVQHIAEKIVAYNRVYRLRTKVCFLKFLIAIFNQLRLQSTTNSCDYHPILTGLHQRKSVLPRYLVTGSPTKARQTELAVWPVILSSTTGSEEISRKMFTATSLQDVLLWSLKAAAAAAGMCMMLDPRLRVCALSFSSCELVSLQHRSAPIVTFCRQQPCRRHLHQQEILLFQHQVRHFNRQAS